MSDDTELDVLKMLFSDRHMRSERPQNWLRPRIFAAGPALVYLQDQGISAYDYPSAANGEKLMDTDGLKQLLGADWEEFCRLAASTKALTQKTRG